VTENSAVPPDWVGKIVQLTIVGIQQDTTRTGRLLGAGIDGCVLRVESSTQVTDRFFPWQAVRQVTFSRT
jgi:hypothetical protein